jgi:hypothetical protein
MLEHDSPNSRVKHNDVSIHSGNTKDTSDTTMSCHDTVEHVKDTEFLVDYLDGKHQHLVSKVIKTK